MTAQEQRSVHHMLQHLLLTHIQHVHGGIRDITQQCIECRELWVAMDRYDTTPQAASRAAVQRG
jgi:hypothetical protein